MNKVSHLVIRICALSGLAAGTLGALVAARGEVTAVSSKVSDDYSRAKRADGSFAPEFYSFGEGGRWNTSPDPTMDPLKFTDVARTIAVPLAGQNYLPGHDPKAIKLLIMVYWGTTASAGGSSSSVAYQNASASQAMPPPPAMVQLRNGSMVAAGPASDPRKSQQTIDPSQLQMMITFNHMRDLNDMRTACVLGYDEALAEARDFEFTALRSRKYDLIDEIEDGRYFVVLMAYDFQLLWKEKKHKLLWETRFSIRERHHDFAKDLPEMAQVASRYFGQDSHGLIRKQEREGHVEIGETKFLDFEPEKK